MRLLSEAIAYDVPDELLASSIDPLQEVSGWNGTHQELIDVLVMGVASQANK
jgi:hypothetical protein